MTRFLALVMSCLFVASLGISEADARRFGGGGSSGNFSRQAAPAPQAPSRQASQPAQQRQQPAAAPQRSGFGGMLMGLAAGGLLAALFMGGAFEGIQAFDILLLLLIVGGVFLFLRSRRQQQPQTATAGGYHAPQSSPYAEPEQPVTPTTSAYASSQLLNSEAEAEPILYGAPDWFNESAFLEGARQHFIDLQAAWDANDLAKIEEYVTPELYQFLCEERQRETGVVKTEVRKLAAELTLIQQVEQRVELAVMFHGVMSESGSPDHLFCEIWHLVRDMQQDNAPWLIQGIEQVEQA